MDQKELINHGPLLNEKGHLVEAGYAKSLIKEYNRKHIKASKFKIKEWDYYLIYDEKYGIALTLDDNSYMGLVSVSILDFEKKREKTVSPMQWFTFGKRNFPSSSKEGDIAYKNKRLSISFKHTDDGRLLTVQMKKFHHKETFNCEFLLKDEPKDSLVIVTPFKENKKAFYYNQKICGFKVSGYFSLGDFKYEYDEKVARGILDWGRGVWTYKNTWYWGAGTRNIDGHEVAFNIGYGFGDTSLASENAVFIDGIMHKLDRVTFNIPRKGKKYDYTAPWTFTSNDGRFEMNFTPILNRKSKTDVGVICSDQNQVFGYFNGTIILDDGNKLVIKDFLAFAERVFNKW